MAIAPFHLDCVLKDIRKADAYVIGVDSATTNHLGLAKSFDLKIRVISEKYKRVIDYFVGTENLGYVTSQVLAEVTFKMLKEDLGLDPAKMLVVSRDNPNVMKGFGRILTELVTKVGNSKNLKIPCALNPTHTSLKKGIDKSSLDVDC